jgi:transcriptional antiterminator
MLFTTLKAEMARKGLKGADIANTLHISPKSAYNKINGITEFTLKETIQIRDKHFPGMTLDVLFGNKKQIS